MASIQTTERTDLVLVLDISESMSKMPEGWNNTKADVQLTEVRRFIGLLRLNAYFSVGVVEFNIEAHQRIGLTSLQTVSDSERVSSSMTGSSRGRTNIANALDLARNILLNSTDQPDARAVILISDGKPTDPDPDPLSAALDSASKAKAAGIVVVSTLLPYSQLNSDDIVFMRRIASQPPLFRYTPSPEDLREWLEGMSRLTYSSVARQPTIFESTFLSFASFLVIPIEFKTNLLRIILLALIGLGLFLLYVRFEKR